jgi:hypothetical protein
VPPSKQITDLSLIQDAAKLAVQAELLASGVSTDQCRHELDALRSEVSTQITSLRADLKESFAGISGRLDQMSGRIDTLAKDVAERGTQYRLIEQRLDLKEEEQDRLMAQRRGTDRTPISNRTSDTPRGYPMGPNPPGYAPYQQPIPAPSEKAPLIKISPKVWNTLILAVVAAAGGTIWHFTERWLFPRTEAPVAHEASVKP